MLINVDFGIHALKQFLFEAVVLYELNRPDASR
jgi:hypothetical protein